MDEVDTVVSYREKYKGAKRKMKWLVYEHECFKEELRKSQQTLLQVSREKSYLLDRLISYENLPDSSSEDEVTALSSEEGEGALEIRQGDSPIPTEVKPKKPCLEVVAESTGHHQEVTVPPLTIKLGHASGGRHGSKMFVSSAGVSEAEANPPTVTPTPKALTSEMLKAIPSSISSSPSKSSSVVPQLITKQHKPSGIKSLPAAPRLLQSIPGSASRLPSHLTGGIHTKLVTQAGMGQLSSPSPTSTVSPSGIQKMAGSALGMRRIVIGGLHAGNPTVSSDPKRGIGKDLMSPQGAGRINWGEKS